MKNAIKKSGIMILSAIVLIMAFGALSDEVYAGKANTINIVPTGEMDADLVTSDWSSDQLANNTSWCINAWDPVEGGTINGYSAFWQREDSSEKYCFFSVRNSDNSKIAQNSLKVVYRNKALKADTQLYHNDDTEIQCWTPFDFLPGNWYRITTRCWNDGKGNRIYGQWVKDISKNKWYLTTKIMAINKGTERFGNSVVYQMDWSNETDGSRDFKLKNYYKSIALGKWISLDQVSVFLSEDGDKTGTVSLPDASKGYYTAMASDEPNEILKYDYSEHIYKVDTKKWDAVFDEPYVINDFKPVSLSKGILKTSMTVPTSSVPVFSYKISVYNSKNEKIKSYSTQYPNVTSGNLSSSIKLKLHSGTYIVNVNALSVFGDQLTRSFWITID